MFLLSVAQTVTTLVTQAVLFSVLIWVWTYLHFNYPTTACKPLHYNICDILHVDLWLRKTLSKSWKETVSSSPAHFYIFLCSLRYLMFFLSTWSLYISPAWSVEEKQQETCVCAVFENLRRNSCPVTQSKSSPSLPLPFPLCSTLLTLPVLLPLLYPCDLSGATTFCTAGIFQIYRFLRAEV